MRDATTQKRQVQSLLKKVVDYHLAEAVEEKSCIDRDASASFFGKDTLSWGGWSPHQAPLPPSLRKADVEVLAGQLQVTRTELGESNFGRGGEVPWEM